MGHWIIDGKQMTDEQYAEYERQEEQAKERVRRETAALMNKLGQTYEALTGLLERNPDVARLVTDRTKSDEEVYRKLRENLSRADQAPRCRWVKQDGTTCGSPQIRRHIYCYAHKQMMESRAMALRLPALEDANAIQIALMRVQKALIDDTITAKKAGLLLYSLQLAVTNVGQTTFGEADERELATDLVDEEEAISSQHPAFSQGERRFTAEDTEPPQQAKIGLAGDPGDAEEKNPEKGLPRINTDHADRRGTLRINGEESSRLGSRMKVERVEVPNVLAMRVGGADWDKPTPNWDGLG